MNLDDLLEPGLVSDWSSGWRAHQFSQLKSIRIFLEQLDLRSSIEKMRLLCITPFRGQTAAYPVLQLLQLGLDGAECVGLVFYPGYGYSGV